MSSEQKVDLNQLRADVDRAIRNEQHGKIASICRTALTSAPNDVSWLRLLCCSQLHLSQSKSLLKLIESYSNNHQIQNALLFYKIYCLYLLKENGAALQLVREKGDVIKSKEERVAIKYLEYQILYRLSEYDAALKVLSQISDAQHLAEIAVNEMSTLIAMDRAADAVHKYFDKKEYESSLYNQCDFVFNLATALILRKKTQQAKSFLMRSITKCRVAMKEEEEDDDVIEAEIATLELLIAYCLFEEGDIANASAYYRKIRDAQQIDGVYENLILENNYLAAEYENNELQNVDNQKKSLLLFKKLLCIKNADNFSRFGASSVELSKAYYNKCIVLIGNEAQAQRRNELEFKELVAKIAQNASELAIFLKVSYHLRLAQHQQICDILSHYLSSNTDASITCHLFLIQILIDNKKYRRAMKQIKALNDDEVKYSEKTIGIALNLCEFVGDKQLKMEFVKECCAFLEEKRTNDELLISLQMDLCQLLISMKQRKEAKETALRLYKTDATNDVYKALLLLTANEINDVELANNVSSEMKHEQIKYDAYAVEELLVEIPNVDADSAQFEITQKSVTQTKREANRRKRQKNALKLRQKYKENPHLYRDPVDWESKKKKDERKRREKAAKKQKKNKNIKQSGSKKKKGGKFRGAQGGNQQSDKFQVYDVGDPRNKKSKGAKTVIPQHIKKRKKRG